ADISGIETLQCMRYAARALELLEEAGVAAPRDAVLAALGEARSNVLAYGTGADVWRRLVGPTRLPAQGGAPPPPARAVATDGELPTRGEVALHDFEASDVRREGAGTVTLATGRVRLVSRATGRARELAAAAVHLGGVDFVCAVKPLDAARFADDAAAL